MLMMTSGSGTCLAECKILLFESVDVDNFWMDLHGCETFYVLKHDIYVVVCSSLQ